MPSRAVRWWSHLGTSFFGSYGAECEFGSASLKLKLPHQAVEYHPYITTETERILSDRLPVINGAIWHLEKASSELQRVLRRHTQLSDAKQLGMVCWCPSPMTVGQIEAVQSICQTAGWWAVQSRPISQRWCARKWPVPVLVIDIGHHVTRLYWVVEGKILEASTEYWGSIDGPTTVVDSQAWKEWRTATIDRIQKTWARWSNLHPAMVSQTSWYLTGGGSLTPGFQAELRLRSVQPLEVAADPLTDILQEKMV